MPEKYPEKYPTEYPEKFEQTLIDCGAEQQEIPKVYRIAYEGVLNEETFESTYANRMRRGKILTEEEKQNVGTYSTSCYELLEDAIYTRKTFMRRQKKAKIVEGKLAKETGYSQRTKERVPEKEDSHIDWWIFDSTNVKEKIIPYFSFCVEG